MDRRRTHGTIRIRYPRRAEAVHRDGRGRARREGPRRHDHPRAAARRRGTILRVSDSELDRDAERFLIHLTVERGVATNTLAAYRRDLRRYVRFLRARGITQAGRVDD